jgi:uncharacterized Zn-binding protein involved in type VI secretion
MSKANKPHGSKILFGALFLPLFLAFLFHLPLPGGLTGNPIPPEQPLAGPFEVSSDGGLSFVNSAFAKGNLPPVADAGFDRTVAPGAVVILDASGSTDPKETALTYAWSLVSLPAGSSAALDDPNAVKPRFTADLPGSYVAELVLTQGNRTSLPDQVTVSTVNSQPVARAGDDIAVEVGTQVTLDASSSIDVDGDLLAFRWALIAKPAGSLAMLDDATSLKPSFQVDLAGTYVAQLIVDDGQEPSRPDTVVISTDNLRPMAEAGDPQTVAIGQVVSLDAGTSVDPNGDPLSFLWSSIKEENGDQTAFSDPTIAAPTFTFTKFGDHVEQVEVSDGEVSAFDTVLLSTINSWPLANGGADQSPHPVAVVQLDGTGSFDFDGNPLSYF